MVSFVKLLGFYIINLSRNITIITSSFFLFFFFFLLNQNVFQNLCGIRGQQIKDFVTLFICLIHIIFIYYIYGIFLVWWPSFCPFAFCSCQRSFGFVCGIDSLNRTFVGFVFVYVTCFRKGNNLTKKRK